MDDDRWEAGMPVLDRQPVAGTGPVAAATAAGAAATAVGAAATAAGPVVAATAAATATTPSPHGATPLPPSLAGLPPRSVPESRPTPLQKHYVLLSVPVLVLGAIAITALELGAGLGSPLVKLCVAIAAPLLIVTTADATLRIWRSAWAWMSVDRGKGLFRLAWVAASLIGLAALLAASWLVLTA